MLNHFKQKNHESKKYKHLHVFIQILALYEVSKKLIKNNFGFNSNVVICFKIIFLFNKMNLELIKILCVWSICVYRF
jgi:hypothetical protein